MGFKRGHSYDGVLIVFEGIDGSGKGTQVARVSRYLNSLVSFIGREFIGAREPGGTDIGEEVRRILLDPKNENKLSPIAELLLFEASRAQLLAERIIPGLEKGAIVTCDRFHYSTLAYQSSNKVSLEDIDKANRIALQGLSPDITFLFDVSPEVAFRRFNSTLDRIEAMGVNYMEKVRKVYLKIASENRDEFRVIDTQNNDADKVALEVRVHLDDYLRYRGIIK